MTRDWHEWHRQYDDPGSSLSRRLTVVREQVRRLLTTAPLRPIRLVSMCAGDGRDVLPVLAETAADVVATLVELDPGLGKTARRTAGELGLAGVEVRTADAGWSDAYGDGAVPADVLLACGVLGNVTDEDAAATLRLMPMLLAPNAAVVWTRGASGPADPSTVPGDPAERLRGVLSECGFVEEAFVRPEDAGFRVGVHRFTGAPKPWRAGVRFFRFV